MLRRLVAVGLVLLAIQLAVAAARGPADGEPVLVAAADVPAGEPIRAGDVVLQQAAGPEVADALTDADAVVGRRASIAISAGEVLTPSRAGVAGALTDLPGDQRAVTVPLIGPADVAPGDRVDVYRSGREEPVVRDALVLSADMPADDTMASSGDGGRLVAAMPTDDAGALVEALGDDVSAGFLVAVRP